MAAIVRTNICTNPILSVDNYYWLSGSGPARVAFNGKFWIQAAASTYTYAGGNGIKGKYYATSMRLNGTPGDSIQMTSTDSVYGAFTTTFVVIIPAGGEIVVQMPSTVAVSGSNLNFGVIMGTGQSVKMTEAFIEKVSGPNKYPGSYFDGSTTSTPLNTFAWVTVPAGPYTASTMTSLLGALSLDKAWITYMTSVVGANNLSTNDLYKKFLETKTGLTNKSVADMEQVYWGGLAGKSNMSIQDYQNIVFNPYQSEELYWLQAQP